MKVLFAPDAPGPLIGGGRAGARYYTPIIRWFNLWPLRFVFCKEKEPSRSADAVVAEILDEAGWPENGRPIFNGPVTVAGVRYPELAPLDRERPWDYPIHVTRREQW